jgi:hypothetical protein
MNKILLLTVLAVAGCCGDLEPTMDSGAPRAMRCVDETGAVVACDEGPRCGFNLVCGGDESVCCPDEYRVACGAGLCGSSEAACAAVSGCATPCCAGEVRCSDGGCDATFAECRGRAGLECLD